MPNKLSYVCLVMALLFIITVFILSISLKPIAVHSRGGSLLFEGGDSGPIGLYTDEDKVKVLDVNNFEENVYNSSSSWLVQFYNSWCGHCISFSPVWKKFADDVYNWRGIVTLAAINCASDVNTQLCRNYEIMGYPTIRYFHPFTKFSTSIGVDFPRSTYITSLRHSLLEMLLNTTESQKIENWPDISPLQTGNLSAIWNSINTTKNFLVIVVETHDSLTGVQLIFDFKDINDLTIRRTTNSNLLISPKEERILLPTIYILYKNLTFHSLPVKGEEREDFYESLAVFLNQNGIFVSKSLELLHTISVSSSLSPSESIIPNKDILINNVYMIDLESALRYLLYHEIPLHSSISNESFSALVNFLHVLQKFFPVKSENVDFLRNLNDEVSKKNTITGEEFRALVKDLELAHYPVFMTQNNWFGCKGSSSKYRGYPCGLWLLAHTLTVGAHDVEPTTVLLAFAGYIKHFFGCSDCTQHFLQMASTIKTDISSLDDNILWLWRAHNNANQRLSKDESEDPVFPKVQFPSPESCPTCRYTNGSWSEKDVLNYLKNMYSNIISVIPNSTHSNDHKSVKYLHFKNDPEIKPYYNFDVDIWVGLYVICICAILVYVAKVFIAKKPRSKHSKQDFMFNKV